MKRVDALQLIERGPLFEQTRLFEFGATFDCAPADLGEAAIRRIVGRASAGWWTCNLADNALTWTTGVYDIFGFEQGSVVTRNEAVRRYDEASGAAMERLRNHAIQKGCGFILDAKIRPASGGHERWMRLVAAPLIRDGQAVSLHGFKLTL